MFLRFGEPLRLLGAGLLLVWCTHFGSAAENANGAVDPKKLNRTVGLDIVTNTVNTDKSVSLTYRWDDKGKKMERTVVVNDRTIVVYNGQIRKFADLTEKDLRAKSVATVGEDGVTTKLLRFGKSPLPKDQLTTEQLEIIASLAPPATAASDAALDKRVAGIVASLDLTDKSKQERLTEVLTANLKAVRDAHNAGLQLDPAVHTNLITGLEACLTASQEESVKDKLTANKLPVTFKAYHEILPNLKPADDALIVAQLQQAREESLDVKNPDDMAPIFKKHKTEIEHYLNSHGYDWAKSYKTFVDAQKPGSASPDSAGSK